MTYAEMLQQIIDESQLSLRQIAGRCAGLNLNITPSYISQLKNGKLPPPSEEVSLTLAKACGSKNQAQLVFQGYLEKAPSLVKEYMLASSSVNKALLESLCNLSGNDSFKEMEASLKQLDILATLDLSSKFLDPESGGSLNNLVRDIITACGGPVEADVHGDQMTLFLSDNSMNPLIPIHSFVYIMPTKTELLKDRDVIAFYPDNRRTPTLRRYFKIRGKILLVPEDKDYETFFYDSIDEIQYLGKVLSYKVDL
ncbi:MAG: hypothetical protein E7223_02615 [Clostridiales bacterium]|nr:hypothetical protein [Clostridiales bacterium]